MIVDYWMPNKAWPNCAVNDPSARVLKTTAIPVNNFTRACVLL